MTSEQKIYFASFGNSRFYGGLKRITKQAMQFKIFSLLFIYSDNYLKRDHEFWKKHGNFIEKNRRLYGYAIWKPYLLLKTFQSMQFGDILLYSDAGCELNVNGKQRLLEYIDIVNSNDKSILGFQLEHLEKCWNKMDLINALNAHHLLNTPQVITTTLFLKKTEKTIKFLTEWYELECNYHLIDDSPSILKNHPNFIEHRHDQSIFSLLCKKHGANILDDETWFESWNKNKYIDKPILARRNSTVKPSLDLS
jgi:hypothetical protein